MEPAEESSEALRYLYNILDSNNLDGYNNDGYFNNDFNISYDNSYEIYEAPLSMMWESPFIEAQTNENEGEGENKENQPPVDASLVTGNKETKRKRRKPTATNETEERRFPYVLWKIINECHSGAIKWSQGGNSILINEADFSTQYLVNGSYFLTKKYKSFVRNLNAYGFYKPKYKLKNSYSSGDVLRYEEFKHESFLKNRHDLLKSIKHKKDKGKTEDEPILKTANILYYWPQEKSVFTKITSTATSSN